MRHLTALLSFFIATAAPALAEDAAPSSAPAPGTATGAASSTRVGLGVSLASGNDVAFSVPIQIGRSFRVEPEFGLFDEAWRGGLGLAWTFPVADQVQGYAGLRFQARGSPDSSEAWYRGAVVIGGEWMPVPRVSLGVEAQVAYTESDSSGGFVDTAGLFIARVYIW